MNLCLASELDLFSPPPLQASILRSVQNAFYPTTTIENAGAIEFFLPANSSAYLDLNSICLRLKVQILKVDKSVFKETKTGTGTDAKVTEPKSAQPGFINNVLHSLFKDVSVKFNKKIVSQTDNYHYKAYIEKVLNRSSEEIESSLQTDGFVKDTAGHFDGGIDTNLGLKTRKKWSDDSTIFELYGRLAIDVFNQSKLLISGINLDISLNLEDKSFFLWSKAGDMATIKLSDAVLYANYCEINPQIAMHNMQKLARDINCIYPYMRSEVKTFTISHGLRNISIDNVFNGILPKNFVVGMVENSAVGGNFEKNPFNFQSFGCSSIAFYINGAPIPTTGFEQDFESGKTHSYSQTYASFLKTTGAFNTGQGSLINFIDYGKGYFLLPMNLSARNVLDETICEDIPQEGSLSIQLKFAKDLVAPISLIVFAEFSAVLEVDKHFNCNVK